MTMVVRIQPPLFPTADTTSHTLKKTLENDSPGTFISQNFPVYLKQRKITTAEVHGVKVTG